MNETRQQRRANQRNSMKMGMANTVEVLPKPIKVATVPESQPDITIPAWPMGADHVWEKLSPDATVKQKEDAFDALVAYNQNDEDEFQFQQLLDRGNALWQLSEDHHMDLKTHGPSYLYEEAVLGWGGGLKTEDAVLALESYLGLNNNSTDPADVNIKLPTIDGTINVGEFLKIEIKRCTKLNKADVVILLKQLSRLHKAYGNTWSGDMNIIESLHEHWFDIEYEIDQDIIDEPVYDCEILEYHIKCLTLILTGVEESA